MLRVHRLVEKEWKTEEGIAAVASAAKALNDSPVWVEAIAPDPDECAALSHGFGIRERTIEDALQPQHPPVFREFDEHVFLIVHAPETSDRKETRKIALFLGQRWLVSIVRAPLPLLEPLLTQLKRHATYFLDAPDLLAHAILDHMAEVFEERVDEMIDQAELLTERAIDQPDPDVLPAIHHLRRRASAFTRIVRTQRDVYQSLARGGCPFLSHRVEPHLRDIADHMLRVYDLLEAVRDGLVAARDSYLTAVNYQLNETMRKLTSIATILLPLGLVGGIFGMNFEHMPLIQRPYGFWIALGGMAAVGTMLYFWLRSRRWL